MKELQIMQWRKQLLFYSIIAMMGTLFIGRVPLSISMITFICISFLNTELKKQLLNFFYSPLLWSMSLLFLLPLISGAWSSERQEWMNILRIKLPLLLLPLAFAGPFGFSQKQWQWVAYIFIALVTAGTIWSIFHYSENIAAVHEGYLKAKTITTPLQNDHVRFSWMISIASFLQAGYAGRKRINQNLLPEYFL